MEQKNQTRTVKSLYTEFNDKFTIDDMAKNGDLRKLRNYLLDRMGQMRGNVELVPPKNMIGHFLAIHLNYSPITSIQ